MVITVQCPSCAESFPVDTNKVPVGGVNARCSLCSTIFRVERPEETIPPPQRPEVEAAAEVPASADVVGAPEVGAGPETEVAAEPEPAAEATAEAAREPEVEAVLDVVPGQEPETDPDPGMEAEPVPEVEPDPVMEAEPEAAREPAVEPVAEAAPEREPEPEMRQGLEPETEPALEPPADGAPEEGADEGGSAAVPEIEDWVFETGPEVRFEELDIPPASSVNRSTPRARPEVPSAETDERETAPGTSEPTPAEDTHLERDPSAAPTGFILGKRDPREKAQRLARVLVSDMIMYNPERHQQALANETLEDDFADEITKSWAEYVDQVGEDLATGTPFWSDALNDILAKGQKIF